MRTGKDVKDIQRKEIPVERLGDYVGKIIIQSTRQLKTGVANLSFQDDERHDNDYETVTQFIKVTVVGKDGYNAVIVKPVEYVELHNMVFTNKTFFVPDEHEIAMVVHTVRARKEEKQKDYRHVMKIMDAFLEGYD